MDALDIIKWENNDNTLVYRFPKDDIRYGSQLIVYPGQIAFFIRGGKIVAEFKSGTHTLKTKNIPYLCKMVNIPFNKESPFKAEIWFVNIIKYPNNKWGTITPLQLEDPKYNIIVAVGAHGTFGFSVKNPQLVLENLVGNMSSFSKGSIVDYFKSILLSKLTPVIYRKLKDDGESILNLNAKIDDISEFVKESLKDDFEQLGFNLGKFCIMGTTPLGNDPSYIKLKESKNARANIDIMGRDNYQMSRSFDVLDKAAANQNSMTGAAISLGAGFGLGSQAASLAANYINTNPTSSSIPAIPKKEYYLVINDEQRGPFSKIDVEQKFRSKEIVPGTYIWKEGMKEWELLSNLPDFSYIFTSCPPPLPPKK